MMTFVYNLVPGVLLDVWIANEYLYVYDSSYSGQVFRQIARINDRGMRERGLR